MNKKFVTGTLAACGIYEAFFGIWCLYGDIYLWLNNIRHIGGSERQSSDFKILMLGFYRNIAVLVFCAVLAVLALLALRYMKYAAVSDVEETSIGKKVFVFSVLVFQFLFLGINCFGNAIYVAMMGDRLSSDMAKPVFNMLLRFTIGHSVNLFICAALLLAVTAACIFMYGIKFEK